MKRKVTSHSGEVEILDELEKGLGIAVVRQHYRAIKLIIGFIKTVKTESGEILGQASARMREICDLFLTNMERALCVCLEGKKQKRSVFGGVLRERVVRMCNN
jgi:hypothetical protein